MHLTSEEHTQLIDVTARRLHELQTSEAFQAAVRSDPPKAALEIFVVYPDRTDAVSAIRRAAADALSECEFAVKDGDDPHMTQRALAPYRDYDVRLLAVRHPRESPSTIIAALRMLGPVAGQLPYSLAAIAKEWGADVPAILAATRRADGSPLPTNLLTSREVFDIPFACVHRDARRATDSNAKALMALYSTALKVAKEGGGRYVVGLMDVAGIYEPLRKRGPDAWTELQGLERKRIMSRVPGSNISTAAICDIPAFEASSAKHHPPFHALMFGEQLRKRSVEITGLRAQHAPLFDAMPHNAQLAPARLAALPYATPFLCMDLAHVSARYAMFRRELPSADVHYAMKCNPDLRLLVHLKGLGCEFEIASQSELEALQTLGLEPHRVLFSNPVRSARQTKQAAAAGVYRFAFDSEDELESLAENAPGASVYVRLSTAHVHSQVGSEGKFGVDVDTAHALMLRARALGLTPYGITFHVGSQVGHTEAWRSAIARSGELMRLLAQDDIRIAMLDLGGGYPAFHRVGLPSLADIAAVIRAALERELPYQPEKLAIEPGRGLVSDAGAMVASVIGVAKRKSKTWVHLDLGGFTMLEALETGHTLDYPVADSVRSKVRMKSHITAATCDSMDTILYDNVALSADLKRGDRVFIYTAGAYSSSYASDFNGFDKPRVYYLP